MKKELSFFVKCLTVCTLIVILSGFYLLYAQNDPHEIKTLGPFTWETTNSQCIFTGGALGTTITIDGQLIQPGDAVAAFVDADPSDDSVNDLCIGAVGADDPASAITVPGTFPALIVWGDDGTTEDKDGAAPNEKVYFKIWQASTDRILYAVQTAGDNTAWVAFGGKDVGLAAVSGISANIAGVSKDVFIGENIYGKAALGLKPGVTYDVYVVADKNNWADGDALTRVGGSTTAFVTDASGNMAAGTLLFANPPNGSYDIIVDVNGNGTYEKMIDYLDDKIQVGAIARQPIITPTANAGGTISPNVPTSVNTGQNQMFTICPDDCHNIKDVKVNDVSVMGSLIPDSGGRCVTYTFTNVTADHTIEVEFEIIVYTIAPSAGENGSITPSTPQQVNCGSNKEFTITPVNDCYEIDDVIVDGTTSVKAQLVNNKYTFTNVTADHTIHATFVKRGPFTITATAGDNGSIAPSQSDEIECGTNVTFIIEPDDCYHIADLMVDGTTSVKNDVVDNGDGTFSYTFVNVKNDHTIHATFAINVYTIVASAGSNGNIDPVGNVPVNCGDDKTFTITANDCYHIAQVLVDGVPLEFNNNAPVDMQTLSPDGTLVSVTHKFENVIENHTISATFAINEYTITALPVSFGTISPSGTVTVNCGSDQLFTITPDECYEISQVFVDGDQVDPSQVTIDPVTDVGTYLFSNVREDHTIAVSISRKIFVIAASAGDNGSIETNGTEIEILPGGGVKVYCGEPITFTMTPAANYRIKEVLLDGSPISVNIDPVTDVGTYTFGEGVKANRSISVTFEPKERTIIASAGDNGSIDPEGEVKVLYATDEEFTITPAPCYKIADVEVDGYSVLGNPELVIDSITGIGTYTFTNVIADHTIHATFEIKVFTITATAGANGSIIPMGAIPVNCGSDQEFTIMPISDCYEIDDVIVDGTSVKEQLVDNKYVFTNVMEDHTIDATFKIKVYTITATAGPNGSIYPNDELSVNCGSNQSFTIAPNPCYEIDKVMVNGVQVSVGIDPQLGIATYIFTNIKANHTIHATFKIKVYTIVASAGTNGSIDPVGSISVNCGTNKAFNITPASCYEIDDVVVNGVSKKADVVVDATGKGTYTFTNVNADYTIHATFKMKLFTIVATAGENGGINPSGDVIVSCGSDMEFTITPASCYEIDDVIVTSEPAASVKNDVVIDPVTGVGTYTFINVAKDRTIHATFKIKVYTITATSNTGGTVVPSGVVNVNCGSDREFVITPDPCYHVDDILVDGVSLFYEQEPGSAVVYSAIAQENGENGENVENPSIYVNFYNVLSNHTLQVVFAIDVYTIIATAGEGGTIDPPGDVLVNCGSDQMFTIVPDDCYDIDDVIVDGESVSDLVIDAMGKTTYTFAGVSDDHTIHATFKIKTFVIKATAGANGIISPSGDIVANCGSDQKFMIVPNTDYHVKDVLVNGVSVGAVTEYTFKAVKKAHTIHATFEINPIRLLSASYDVPDTRLTLRFDRPVRVNDPYVPCFDCIGMSVGNSGLMDFALSSNPNQNLKDRVWTEASNRRIVHIDINRAYTTTINLAVAAFISHKAENIRLLLSCDDVFTGFDGAKTEKADVPLPMMVNGCVLGVKGDVTGDGELQTIDAGNILKASVKGLDVLPVYEPGKVVDNILIGAGYTKADTPLYTADWNGNNVVDAQDAADMLNWLADRKIKAPSLTSAPKIGRLNVSDYSNGKLNVSIDLDNSMGVYAADIVVAYDPNVLNVSQIAKAFATSGWLLEEAVEPGKIKIAMAGLEQPSENGSLVDMAFDAASTDVIGKIDIVELKLNGGNLKATIESLPKKFALLQNYPNPFNPETWIPYQLVEPCEVTITIYNANGQVVRRLELGNRMPGSYVDKAKAAYWDGSNESGERVSSGIYFYQLQAGKDNSVRKMIVVK